MRSPEEFFFFNQENGYTGFLGNFQNSCTGLLQMISANLNPPVQNQMSVFMKITDDLPRIGTLPGSKNGQTDRRNFSFMIKNLNRSEFKKAVKMW